MNGEDAIKSLTPFLEKHCYECHDDDVSKGDLDIYNLDFKPKDPQNFAIWERIFERVEDNEMPPKKKKRPEVEFKKTFLTHLKKPLIQTDLSNKQIAGRVNVRRLTRNEYTYSMYDLLGIDIPLLNLLPEDPVTHGFETVATGQHLSHFTMKRYLDVADISLRNAFKRAFTKEKPLEKTYSAEVLTTKKGGGNFRGPQLIDGFSVAWPHNLQFYGRMMKTKATVSGWYEITLKNLHAVNPKNGVIWGTLKSGACASNAPLMNMIGIVEATEQKRDVVYRAWVEKGHALELKANDNTLKRAKSTGKGGNIDYNGTDNKKNGIGGVAVSGIHVKLIHPNGNAKEIEKNLMNGLTLKKLEAAKGKPEFKKLIDKAVQDFAYRAFRRSVSAEQLKPYLDIAHATNLEKEIPIYSPLYHAYRAILCSPRFLTLVEKNGKLDHYAIATRLSYMLWNSIPDAELLEAAKKKQLKDPKVLVAQADRMLADKKADRFIESFTNQWLSLRDMNATLPDRRMYKTYDQIVHESMLKETRASFKELIKKNYSVTQILDSNFNMFNERLARHYGIDDVKIIPGKGIQKVSLGNQKRGGLVTQGAILKVTANGTSTSPILRGVWLSEKVLGVHIPPPPTNVPAIEPDIRGAVSIRDQMEKHRSDESCASCHHKIDPTGFAFENFDPVGAWRTKYGTKKNALKVDASGVTADGKKFTGINEWKKLYTSKPNKLAQTFAQQLITYSTGAEPRFSDKYPTYLIANEASKKKYGMRSILHATITSPLFLTK